MRQAKLYLFFFSFLCVHNASAQNNIRWQQQVNTQIQVRLDDQKHFLHGLEEMEYINNSPDTLQFIYLHLYPNAYKHDRTAFSEQLLENYNSKFYYSAQKDRGYIDSLRFTVNGVEANFYCQENEPDIARLDLPNPLLPGQRINIVTPFRVKLPKVFSRLGHTGNAYFISQWFPKPAVYNHKGWHPMPYLDQGEFFSEYGNYDVHITLPKNYVVMATGNLQTETEQAWIDSLALLSEAQTNTRQKADTSYATKTIRYTESNVHDFAWFADKRYVVRKETVPHGNDSVTLYAAYVPYGKHSWHYATKYLRNTLDSLGKWVGPYPYKTMKAVNGDMASGGGMEYPTITIIDRTGERDLETVIKHEAGHNWFYGILGNNEREQPFMDEGINSFYERRLTTKQAPDTSGIAIGFDLDGDVGFQHQTALGKAQSVKLAAQDYQMLNYGTDVYLKSALLLYFLEEYLGKERFDAAMQAYFTKWKLRHPDFEDFRSSMEQNTGENLSWFFDELLDHNRKIKTGITRINNINTQQYAVSVFNHSGIALPAVVYAYKHDTLLAQKKLAPFEGTQEVSFELTEKPTHFTSNRNLPDFAKNKKTSWLAKNPNRAMPIKFGARVGNAKPVAMSVLPAVGVNNYDGFMGGLLVHNLGVPQSQFQYALAPMYSFKAKTWAGAGTLGYTFLPKHLFRQVLLQADFKSFHYNIAYHNAPKPLFARYRKVAPGLTFLFKEPSARSSITRALTVKGYWIREDDFDYQLDPTDSIYKPQIQATDRAYGLLRYKHDNERMLNPYSYIAEAQLGSTFAKLSLEGSIKIHYNVPRKGLFARGYIGKFINLSHNYFANSRYWLNTSYTASNDYLYDGTYLGRSEREGILSRQFAMKEGGESLPTHLYASPLGRSDNWLLALNLRTDLPLTNLPLRLYLNASTFSDAQKNLPSGAKLLYSGGLQFYVLNDLLLVNFPILLSKDYQEYNRSIVVDKKFARSISFSLNLDHANILRIQDLVTNKLLRFL